MRTNQNRLAGAGGILIVVAVAAYLFFRPLETTDFVVTVPPPSATTIPAVESTMLFVGDIMLSRQVGTKIVASGDWRYPFLRIAEFLHSADLTFGNLENPVSDRGVKVGSIYSFRADPRTMQGLKYAGFDVVSLANNHIWDYGREAFLDTMGHLAAHGIEYVGAGPDFATTHRGVTRVLPGDTRVTILAYTDLLSKQLTATATGPGISYLDRAQMIADIQAARLKADILVITIHKGTEYETVHNADQEVIYQEAINAGADLVVGHHPHVAQEVVQYKNGWIAYSLGNFIFDQYFSKETMESIVLKVTAQDKKISKVESIPIGISLESQAYLK